MSFQIYTEDTTHSDSMSNLFYLPIYEVDKCKFYIYDGIKYHIRFPLEWATEHYSFPIHIDNQQNEELEETGPYGCQTCQTYGTVNGIFIGYCEGCKMLYKHHNEPRGNPITTLRRQPLEINNLSIEEIENNFMWEEYPYMYGINKRDITDGEQSYDINYGDNNNLNPINNTVINTLINRTHNNDNVDNYTSVIEQEPTSVMDLDPDNIC